MLFLLIKLCRYNSLIYTYLSGQFLIHSTIIWFVYMSCPFSCKECGCLSVSGGNYTVVRSCTLQKIDHFDTCPALASHYENTGARLDFCEVCDEPYCNVGYAVESLGVFSVCIAMKTMIATLRK